MEESAKENKEEQAIAGNVAANSNETIQEDSEAQAYLDHLLNHGCKEGDSGIEMSMPDYYDERLFKQGQSFMKKYRFVMTAGMLFGLAAVLAIPSILRVLICTKQSSTAATAYRRYLRTILHLQSWYSYTPCTTDSKFWISVGAVRKGHLRSSHLSAKKGAGQITQKDLALTQFGFIGFILHGAHRIELNDQEFFESTSHMWRVLGHLLGIKDEYNICGRNYKETKKRLDIVMRKVFNPALENVGEDFDKMVKPLVEGLADVTTVTVDSFLFFTKRLAYVRGYEYYDFDYPAGRTPEPQQRRFFNDLGWWDRFVVSYGLFMVTYLHKYDIVRWYMNFRVWLTNNLIYYLPFLPAWKYGLKWAYVRIFTGAGKALEFRIKEE